MSSIHAPFAAAQLNTAITREIAALGDAVKARFPPRYLELATLVSAHEDGEATRIAAFMGEHERALVALAAKVASGAPDPVAPVAALLHFPLPRPA